jgi:hypothetical protein
MDWAAEDRSHIDILIEFESRVNDVCDATTTRSSAYMILRSFGGNAVIDIMRTHPMIIIGGILQQNPFFVPGRRSSSVNFANGVPGRLRRPRRWPDMEVQLEHPAEEIRRLRRCINDLVSVIALPAMWSAVSGPRLFAPCSTCCWKCSNWNLVYVRLENAAGEARVEMARVAQPRRLPARPQEIGELLHRCLGADPLNWPSSVRNRIGEEDISIVPLRLGLQGEIGFIVAGSQRPDFPGQTERLLLSVAANQATIGLQESAALERTKADHQGARSFGSRNELQNLPQPMILPDWAIFPGVSQRTRSRGQSSSIAYSSLIKV